MDYNLFGHQIVCHQIKGYNARATANAVDGDPVPVPHFGLALSVQQFHDLADRVKQADVKFVIQPHLRFEGSFRHRLACFLQPLYILEATWCINVSHAGCANRFACCCFLLCSILIEPSTAEDANLQMCTQVNLENSGQCSLRTQVGMRLSLRP